MKWYIGQDIVCIKSHSQGAVKEGDVFIIKGIKKSCCSIDLDINFIHLKPMLECPHCHKLEKSNGIYWFDHNQFAPLESITDISEIEELLKEPIFQK